MFVDGHPGAMPRWPERRIWLNLDTPEALVRQCLPIWSLSEEELESMIRMVQSQMQMRLSRVLADEP